MNILGFLRRKPKPRTACCPECGGSGITPKNVEPDGLIYVVTCWLCNGTGQVKQMPSL